MISQCGDASLHVNYPPGLKLILSSSRISLSVLLYVTICNSAIYWDISFKINVASVFVRSLNFFLIFQWPWIRIWSMESCIFLTNLIIGSAISEHFGTNPISQWQPFTVLGTKNFKIAITAYFSTLILYLNPTYLVSDSMNVHFFIFRFMWCFLSTWFIWSRCSSTRRKKNQNVIWISYFDCFWILQYTRHQFWENSRSVHKTECHFIKFKQTSTTRKCFFLDLLGS